MIGHFWAGLDAWGYLAAEGMLSLLWQSSILLLAVALVAHALRRRPAKVRHAVWTAGLLTVALVPLANGLGSRFDALQRPVAVMPAYHSTAAPPAGAGAASPSRLPSARPPVVEVSVPVASLDEVDMVPGESLRPVEPAEDGGRTPGALRFHPWAWGVVLYVLGVLLMLSRLAVGWRRLARLTEAGRPLPDAEVTPFLPQRPARLPAIRRVPVIECRSLTTPMTAGVARQVILVPAGFFTRESAGDLQAMLTHEIAHIERNDPRILWIASILRSILFFHPLIWIATRRIATLAEHAADERVLEEAASPAEYARVLTRMAERLPTGAAPIEFSSGAMLSQSALVSRVKAVLDWREPARGLSRAGVVVTVAAVLLAAGLAFALPIGEKAATANGGEREIAPPAAAPVPVVSALPAGVPPAAGLPAPEDAVVFDPNLMWYQCAWADKITYYSWDEERAGSHYFWVGEPGKRYVWNYYFGAPVSAAQYQRLTLTYRARNTPALADAVIWLDDGRGPGAGNGVSAVRSRDVISDGEVHEVSCDLAAMKPAGDYTGMFVGVTCAEKAPAEFELLGLRLDRNPGVNVDPPGDDAPIQVCVVDAAGNPVPEAVVAVEGERLNSARRALTDAAGLATIVPVKTLNGKHTVSATRSGWTRVEWKGVTAAPQPIRLRIDPTLSCSGKVVDAAGAPVPGMVVDLHSRRFFEGQRTGAHQQGGISLLTDENGVWRCRAVDATATDLSLRLTHPLYPLDDTVRPGAGGPTFEQMRDGTGVSRVSRGFAVTGVVRNAAGAPLKGAMVTWRRYQVQCGGSPAYSDAQGKFEFTVAKPAFLRVVFTAPEYGPAVVEAQASPGMAPISATLGAPHSYHFRVVGTDGRPVPGATVSVLSWREQDSVFWRGTADQDGRVSWLCGPPDRVVFDVSSKTGMMRRTDELAARDEPYVITLAPPLRISGTVTDAETGRPIDRFRVSEGFTWNDDDNIYWQQMEREPVRGGAYSREFRFPYKFQYIRIEADGYAPAVSRPYKAEEGTQTFNVALKRPLLVGGVVRDKDGRPVADAKVTVLPNARYVRFVDGEIDRKDVHRTHAFTTAQTDAEGRYYIPEQDSGLRLFVSAAEGVALVSREEAAKSRDVTLQPWARVAGAFMIGSHPAAGRKIIVRADGRDGMVARPGDSLDMSWTVAADATGRFVFDRLVPGKLTVADFIKLRDVPGGGSAWGGTQHRALTVAPGGVAEVKLGGMGRPVIGQLDYPKEVVAGGIGRVEAHVTTRLPARELPAPPADFGQWTDQQRSEWHKKNAEEFNARQREVAGRIQHYYVIIQPDGSFRVDDVLAGDYNLSVTVSAPGGSTEENAPRTAAQATVGFTIPEMPGGRSDEPLDLGRVVPRATPKP